MSFIGTRIVKLLVIETGRYHDMWRRTYHTEWGGNVQQALDERLSGLTHFTPSVVAGVAGQFIKVDAAPEKVINIPQGFGGQRFRFMMQVEIVDPMGIRTLEILTGYSDTLDTSFGTGTSRHISPDTVFNINSIMQVMERQEMTPMGRQTYRSIVDNSHLLYDKHSRGMASGQREDFIRPEDVFSLMSLNSVATEVAQNSYDARTVMSQRPVKSARSNGVASNYMAKIMEGHNSAWLEQQMGGAEQGLYSAALGNVAEMVASTDPFLNVLRNIRGKQSVEGIFTLRDLEKIDPGALNNPQITKTAIFGEAERSSTDMRQQSAEWHNTTLENQWAAILSQTVPALLMDLTLMGIEFTATNRAMIGAPNTVFTTGHLGLEENVDMSKYIAVFERRMADEVLRDLSNNGMIDYHIVMRIDILNEMNMKISIGGKPATPFSAGAFCDALYVPIVTGDRSKAVGIANDFESMHAQIVSSGAEKLPMSFNVQSSY